MSEVSQNAVGGLIANGVYGAVTLVLSRIQHEIKLARHHKEHLQELGKQLDELSELLKGSAKLLQPNNKLLNAWLKKVNNAAYDVDNLLDDCSYESYKHGSRTRKRDKSKSLFSKPLHCHVISHRVNNLTNIIKTIYADAKNQGIVLIEVAAGHSYDSGSSSEIQGKMLQDRREWVDNQGLVGRDQDITRLAELLCDSNNNCKDPTVIGIVGLPGLGKTALGKRVVKAKEVKRHFKSIFWLVASHSYDLTDILRKMAEQLDENVSNMSSPTIVKKLGGKLKGKRYLVVLDDVWDTFDWGPFKCTLEEIGGSKGTTVLMTSRDKNVLAKMDTKFHVSNDQYIHIHKAIMHQLKELNEDDSWDLFKQRLGRDNLAANSEKIDLGKRMVNKCGGIPLAIRALGDLLCNKNVEEWRCIEKNEEWNKEEHGILPSLKLSYIYLPNMALKKCFSYCAIFGEDKEIQKEKLIQLWMGQGFLQPYDNMERVGDEYVNILLNTSLFQEAKLDLLGNVITFKLHDLVLSLARIVSGECWNLKEKTEVNVSSLTDFRHLSSPFSLTTKLPTTKFRENLRTYYNYCPQFLPPEFESLKLFLKHSKCLRVLCLQRLCLDDLPKSVGDLKHLRYLDISQNCFQSLPVVITKLYHLQVLRIDYNANCQLYCSLRQFEVRFLENLRHISAKAVDIGILAGMRHLTALQTLSTINLKSNWGGKVIELRDLNNLRGTLGIKGLENMITEEEARSLNLGNKLNVDRLFLEWSDKLDANDHHNQILQHLEPHENLSTLDVAHYNGTTFPEWLMTMTVVGGSHRLSKLVSLTLRHCLLAEGELKLENLGSLRFLSLESCYGLTISFPSNGFRCCTLLESLKLTSCCNIRELRDMSPLTQLQYLEIRDCDSALYELKGLAGLPFLKEVITDRLLPQDLGRRSPLCKALQTLYLSTQAAGNSLPIQLQYLVALKELHISDFQSLEILPDWLGKLTSLSSLTLQCLPKLKQMPSTHAIQCLSNLKVLRFWECPLLEEQINQKHGEWSKIKHIPLSSFESN